MNLITFHFKLAAAVYTQNTVKKHLPKNNKHEIEQHLLIFGYFSIVVREQAATS